MRKRVWERLEKYEKHNIRNRVMRKIRLHGPMTLDELQGHFMFRNRLLIAPAIRQLIGSNLVYKDRLGRYVPYESDPKEITDETRAMALSASRIGPGPNKVPVLAARYMLGIDLWNADDNTVIDVPSHGQMTHREFEADDEDLEVI